MPDERASEGMQGSVERRGDARWFRTNLLLNTFAGLIRSDTGHRA